MTYLPIYLGIKLEVHLVRILVVCLFCLFCISCIFISLKCTSMMKAYIFIINLIIDDHFRCAYSYLHCKNYNQFLKDLLIFCFYMKVTLFFILEKTRKNLRLFSLDLISYENFLFSLWEYLILIKVELF